MNTRNIAQPTKTQPRLRLATANDIGARDYFGALRKKFMRYTTDTKALDVLMSGTATTVDWDKATEADLPALGALMYELHKLLVGGTK